MTSRMSPLLEHNEEFAHTYTPVPLGMPAAQVIVVTCLDHRIDPAITASTSPANRHDGWTGERIATSISWPEFICTLTPGSVLRISAAWLAWTSWIVRASMTEWEPGSSGTRCPPW